MIFERYSTRSPSTRSSPNPRITTNSATRSSANAAPRLKRFSPHTFPVALCKCRAAMERRKSSNCKGMRLNRISVLNDATTDAIHSFRVMLDASARRFQAQKIYLRAVAAVRWANSRNAILQGQMPHSGNAVALQQADDNLRAVSFDRSTYYVNEELTRWCRSSRRLQTNAVSTT